MVLVASSNWLLRELPIRMGVPLSSLSLFSWRQEFSFLLDIIQMVSLPDEKKVRDLIGQNFHINAKRYWILMNYKDPNTVVLAAHGAGPLSEVIPQLRDDQMQYLLIRLPLDDQAQHVAQGSEITVNKIRDVFVAWTGPKVGLIEKGKKKSHIGALQKLLSPSHAELQAVNRDHFTEENLKYKSDPKSGSHIID